MIMVLLNYIATKNKTFFLICSFGSYLHGKETNEEHIGFPPEVNSNGNLNNI